MRGKSGYVPFWPGGLDNVLKDSNVLENLNERSKGLRTVAPGLSRGLRFPGDEVEDSTLPDFEATLEMDKKKDIDTVKNKTSQAL